MRCDHADRFTHVIRINEYVAWDRRNSDTAKAYALAVLLGNEMNLKTGGRQQLLDDRCFTATGCSDALTFATFGRQCVWCV